MKTYEVEIEVTNSYELCVKANSEEEAKEKAVELYTKDPSEYFDDSDMEVSVFNRDE